MSAVTELVPALPIRRAVRALGASHATWYRRQAPKRAKGEHARVAPPLALSAVERDRILTTLNDPLSGDN